MRCRIMLPVRRGPCPRRTWQPTDCASGHRASLARILNRSRWARLVKRSEGIMHLVNGKPTRRHLLSSAGAAALAAPFVKSAQAQAGKTIVFGGSVPLTGAAAETGLNVNNGYITAVTYMNEVLGGVEIAGEKYKLELKLFDDASDPARATTLIQRQIDEGTNFFLGSFGSNIVLPTAAITERAKKPMVQTGGGSDAIFTRGYKFVFGMYPRATRQFAATAAMFKSLKPTPQ